MKDEFKKLETETFLEYSSRIYREKEKLGLTNFEIYEKIKENTNIDKAESRVRCSANDFNKRLLF